jgi:hypothetical protein
LSSSKVAYVYSQFNTGLSADTDMETAATEFDHLTRYFQETEDNVAYTVLCWDVVPPAAVFASKIMVTTVHKKQCWPGSQQSAW